MFTGIVECLGRVRELTAAGKNARLAITVPAAFLVDVRQGDSIAVNGVCLTANQIGADYFSAELSPETLHLTTLGSLAAQDAVNLEKAVRADQRLGGHLVSGHVDGMGRVVAVERNGEAMQLAVLVPAELKRYIVRKGSVCVDGVSLTVNETEGDAFAVQIIPHTRQVTLCGQYQVGSRVNIEVDQIARYLESLLAAGDGNPVD